MARGMKRVAAAVLVGGLGSAGCVGTGHTAGSTQPEGWTRYYNAVDPCWPERYTAQARAEVLAPFAAQVNNGHVLEQTVWNWHFETGSDVLTPAGQVKLDTIAQARPQPDGRVYLQVARDVPVYAAGGLETVAVRRDELTARRADAVRKYLAAQPSLQPVTWEVFVHDAPVPSMPAEFSARAYRGQANGVVGGLRFGGVAVTATGGGANYTGTAPAPGTGPVGPAGAGGPGGPNGSPGGSGGPTAPGSGPNF